MSEWITDYIMLAVIAAGLLLTLFHYIETRQRAVSCAVLFYLANMMSQYYRTSHQIVTGVSPDAFSFIANPGWNIAYIAILVMARVLEERGTEATAENMV